MFVDIIKRRSSIVQLANLGPARAYVTLIRAYTAVSILSLCTYMDIANFVDPPVNCGKQRTVGLASLLTSVGAHYGFIPDLSLAVRNFSNIRGR